LSRNATDLQVSARTRRRPHQRLYLPSFVLAAVTAWFVWEGVTTLQRYGELGSALAGARAELAGPLVLVFVAVALGCERLWPAERRRLLAKGHLQDALYLALFVGVMIPLITLLGVASAHLLVAHVAWLEAPWTKSWPRWLLVGVTLVAMDGCNWLTHWADHRYAALWRVHAIHHSQEEVSILTTFRTHPLVHTASFVAAAVPVIALMGARPIAPVLITVYLCLGALPHANVPWTFGPLGKVVVSPAYHRIHHRADGRNDINLAIVLPIWDILARRAVFPERGATPCRTGLAGRPIPVEQDAVPLRLPLLLLVQLAEPFAPAGTTSRETYDQTRWRAPARG
jgi:sterol desaturase/sphingolipid hydroxylase (fatty acid hydroxylase superfamily)